MKSKKILSIILTTVLSLNMLTGVSAAEADRGESVDIVELDELQEDLDSDIQIDSEESEQTGESDEIVEIEADNGSAVDITEEQTDEADDASIDNNLEIGESIADALDDTSVTYANTCGNMVGGYVPSDIDLDVPSYDDGMSRYRSVIPSSFPTDMNTYYNTYPAVRNQGNYGTCWSFASLGLSEFDLINKGYFNNSADLSELQLAYFTYNFVEDPLGGTAGDTSKFYNDRTASTYLSYGGNYKMAAIRLNQWIGAADETSVPYSQASGTLTAGLDNSYAYNYDVAHLRNAYVLDLTSNTDDVKENIMEHGAVGIIYHHKDSKMARVSSEGDWTYYNSEEKNGSAHAVMIVGWDDNYSVENFPESNRPSGNGAWLVRNSWGNYISYFWMSYENKALMKSAWVFDVVPASDDEYDNNYQLDGGIEAGYYKSITCMANVFTVNAKENVHVEMLKAVSLSFLNVTDISYKIDIYTNLTDTSNPTSGTLQESAHTEGATTYAGIYTVNLSNPVTLKPGTSYSVVVAADKPGLNFEKAKEYLDGSTTVFESTVSVENGRSFYRKSNNTFAEQKSYGNFCIKAYTSNVEGGHVTGDAVIENKIDATCISTGSYERVLYCTLCGDEVSRTKQTIAKKAHSYGTITYQSSGVTKTCKVCKAKTVVNYTGIHKAIDKSTYYYQKGKVVSGSENIIKSGSTWYYINKKGKVDYSFTGIAKNKNGIFYIYKGKVNFKKTGLVKSKGTYNGWFYVKKGKVQLGKENIVKNNGTWYYVNKKGRVDLSFKGIASNSNGTYYLEKGRVNFKKTIARYKDPRTKHYYRVVKGRAKRIK